MNRPLRCVWRNSHTAKGGIGVMPPGCKKLKCPGVFKHYKPLCQSFIEDVDFKEILLTERPMATPQGYAIGGRRI